MPKNNLLTELEKFDRESARKLNEILSIIARHKRTYESSKDPAIAQIWLAIVEIYSRQEKLQRQIADISVPEHAEEESVSSKLKELLKKKKDDSDILETLENY